MTLEKDVLGEDGCENAAKVASKYGYQIVCDDDEEEKVEEAKENDPVHDQIKQKGREHLHSSGPFCCRKEKSIN